MARLILFNKPYGVLSQFTDRGTESARPTLSRYIAVPGVYPAGRLDRDSEGLLLLCDDGRLQARIADPRFKLAKTYLVQVEGEPDEASLEHLREGVRLKDGPTRPAEVVRLRDSAKYTHFEMTLTEGRNRQVRRMVEALGARVLKLVRVRIGPIAIGGLPIGRWRALTDAEIAAVNGVARHFSP